MAGIQSVSFTSPYSQEEQEIERRRRLADALQQQGQQGLGPTEMVGGWAIKKSPFEGLSKAAQQISGAYQNEKLNDREKALQEKYSSDYRSMVAKGLRELNGTPAQPGGDYEDSMGIGRTNPGQSAVAPDPMAALSTFGSHPQGAQLAPLAMQQIQTQQRQKMMADILRGGGQGGAPAASGAPGAAPGPAGASPRGGFGAGIPKEIMALMVSGDSELVGLGKSLLEANKGIAQRPGAPVVNPFTGEVIAQPTPSVPNGVQLNVGGPGGTSAAPVPGFSGAMEGIHSIPNPSAPPIKLPTSGGQTIELTQPEYVQWQRTKQLPARFGGQPQPQVPQAAPAASPAGFPRETQQELVQSGNGSLGILNAEAKKFTDGGQPVPPDLAQEIANATKRAGGQYPANAPKPPSTSSGLTPQGLGVVGATQTQEDQIRQAREMAAGKEVDQTFAKDYVAFKTGGAQDVTKQLAQLQDVTKQLAAPGADLTGPFRGSMPDGVQKFTSTGRNAIAMRERVEEVVQRSLRAILGGQFTEKEGERLIARAYNPSLSEKENGIRVGRLMTQLQQAYQSKSDAAQYFEKNNTLQGWNGKLPSIGDFDPDRYAQGKIGKAAGTQDDPLGLR